MINNEYQSQRALFAALFIVNEFKANDPVTLPLIPIAALDDVIVVTAFFADNSIISATATGENVSVWEIVLPIFLPLAIGIAVLLAKQAFKSFGELMAGMGENGAQDP